MVGKLLRSEQTNVALVGFLSGPVMVLVAKGSGSLSPKRVLGRILPDPVAWYGRQAGQFSRPPLSASYSRKAA
jgi:hypothetical protein